MGFFDTLKKQILGDVNREINKGIRNSVDGAIKKATEHKNKSEEFTFAAVPKSVDEIKALKEATLDTPFKTAALSILALLNYENDKEETFKMLDFLSGPEPLSPREKAFITERLGNAPYIVNSFFAGSTVQNNYTPNMPYKITVSDNPYSYTDETHCKMFVTSAGADSPREIQLRKKPSTGQWFLVDLQCLSGIRIPVKDDAWA